MDKVTGCAKLYSEFGIMVVRFADKLKKLLQKHYRAKVYLSPCVFYSKSFEIKSRVAGHNNYELRIPN